MSKDKVMKRISLRLIIAILTFLIGLSAATLWFIHRIPAVNKSSDALVNAPMEFCDLVKNPEPNISKIVRVKTTLVGYHELALYDSACGGAENVIRADFDVDVRRKLVEAIASLNGAGFQHGNFWAKIILLGRLERVPDEEHRRRDEELRESNLHYVNYRYRFVVSDVERVEAMPQGASFP